MRASGKSEESDQESAAVRPEQLVKALGHPIRREILLRLAGGPQSPATVARAMGKPTRDLMYHVKVLVRDCGVLEPVGEDPPPTGGQRFRVRTPMRFVSLELGRLPVELANGMVTVLVNMFLSLMVDAGDAGSITGREGTTLSARPGVLDPEGWTQANSVLRSADEEVELIEAESRARLKASGNAAAIHAAFGIALFEAASAQNLPPGQSVGGDS